MIRAWDPKSLITKFCHLRGNGYTLVLSLPCPGVNFACEFETTTAWGCKLITLLLSSLLKGNLNSSHP